MKDFLLLIRLYIRIFINTYLKTRKQQVTTWLICCLMIALITGIAYVLHRFVLVEIINLYPGVWIIGFILFGIFSFAFGTSLNNLIPQFYRAPDLNCLLTMPILPNRILAVKFFIVQLKSIMGVSVLSLALLVGIGWTLTAPWYYYILLLPLYLIYLLVPAGLGLLFGIALLRLFTPKTIARIAGLASLFSSVGYILALGFADAKGVTEWVILSVLPLIEWFRSPWIELFTPVSAAILFEAIATGEFVKSIRPLFMLLLVTAAAMAAIFLFSKNLFYRGWLIAQSSPGDSIRVSKEKDLSLAQTRAKPLWYTLVLIEWRLAVRNKEMRFMYFAFMVLFAGLIYALATGVLPGVTSMGGLVILAVAAAKFLPAGILLLFMPMSFISAGTGSAKSILKSRYSILKILPTRAWEIFLATLFKVAVPTFLSGTMGIVVYAVLSGSAFLDTVAALTGFLLLLCGTGAINLGVEFWDYAEESFSVRTFLLKRLIMYGYFFSAVAPIALFLLSDMHIFTVFRIEALFTIGLVSWPIMSVLAILCGLWLFVRSWKLLEI